MTKTKINVPGRVHDFYTGGGAYQAWTSGNEQHRDWPEADELELFQAVSEALTAGKRRTAKGGWWVPVELSAEGLAGLRYWAETLETASSDGAAEGDQDSRNDLRAAHRVLKALS